MQTYTVQTGDTLFGISRQFGIPIEEIKEINQLTNNTLIPGQVLKIPTPTTTILYTVKQGDNLYKIAQTYHTTVDELMRINNLQTNALSIGQQLIIPIQNVNENNNYITYIIKANDNLYTIANTYNTTVNAIKNLNHLSSNLLSIGQSLKIPINESIPIEEYQTYIVKSSDNLYTIAKEFGMTVNELIQLNNLNSNLLSIGQVLKVKKQPDIFSETITYEECYGENYTPITYETYTVKSGDNLYTIARRFNTTIEQLMILNHLTSNNLSIGQVLKIREVIE